MEHPTETTLGLYALDPTRVQHRAVVEAHLASCSACRAGLDEIKAFDAALAEPETWLVPAADAMTVPSAVEELRRFAARAAAEDASAADLLRPFEDREAASRFVWMDLARKLEYQTGGVARRLCRLANSMCERQPLYALSLAETATQISVILPDASYPRDTIHELRGEAWKEQANAFHHLGRFNDALAALASAEAEYRQLRIEGIGLVAVNYARAGVLYEQEQFEAADALARESADAARELGAVDRYMRARHLQGVIRFERRQFAEAAEIFASVLAYGEHRNDAVWIARESLTLGNCYVALQDAARAAHHLYRALQLFRELDFGAEVTRTNWAIARLSFLQGSVADSINRLRGAIRELTGYSMLTDAAVAAVDLAEILNSAGRTREIPKLLAGVVETFTDAGKLTGALTALAYVKDAALRGSISLPLFAYVRRFITRSDREAEVLFLPPSGPPL